MQLTKESEYALLGLAALAASPTGEVTPLSKIVDDHGLPASFLAKIFQKLARHGLLTATRGPRSGYFLARSADAITLRTILESVEGPQLFEHCLLLPGHGDHNPCSLHHYMEPILAALIAKLESITLSEYAASLENGRSAFHGPTPSPVDSHNTGSGPSEEL